MKREVFLKLLIENKYGNVKAFSEAIDIPYTTVRTILEKGVGNARINNILKICKGLGISVEQLNHDFEFDNTVSEIIKKVSSMNKEEQNELLDYINKNFKTE
ncbi:helix-turn-helix domain-containing protein [Erwinia sp. CPCC 100877]|nr:helix-turn-helix domain-containing protein [Erwinia sp. CPCC 100877]